MENQEIQEMTVNQTETMTEQNSNQNYIDAINQLKSTTVSKDSYNKLMEENKNLLSSLVNGNGQVSTETDTAEEKVPLSQLRKELFTPAKELSDLEYVTKALELRERVLEETGEDCFVGASHSYTPTAEDYAKAAHCAEVYKECIEDANGDNGRFIAALQSRMNDVFIPQVKRK